MLANQQKTGREKAFGAWQKKKIDSQKFVRNLREEWE